MEIGFIGLGRMGKNIVLNLLEHGIEVVAWNRSQEPISNIKYQISNIEKAKRNFTDADSIEDLVENLPKPRTVWLMLPAGEVTDEYIDKLLPILAKEDLIIDGANSFYKDTLRRVQKIKPKGIHFMDIGVSGGPGGARNGACLMIGGAEEDVDRITEIIKAVAAPNGWGYFGQAGSGHFAKMVHNGIEYGMMEAIGEGAAILKFGPFKLDLAEVFRVYNNRSVIESRLVGWTQEALSEDPDLKDISSEIKSTGEGEWTVKTAKELDINAPVIGDSFKVRQASGNDPENSPQGFRNKVVSAMRGKFGQHEVRK